MSLPAAGRFTRRRQVYPPQAKLPSPHTAKGTRKPLSSLSALPVPLAFPSSAPRRATLAIDKHEWPSRFRGTLTTGIMLPQAALDIVRDTHIEAIVDHALEHIGIEHVHHTQGEYGAGGGDRSPPAAAKPTDPPTSGAPVHNRQVYPPKAGHPGVRLIQQDAAVAGCRRS